MNEVQRGIVYGVVLLLLLVAMTSALKLVIDWSNGW